MLPISHEKVLLRELTRIAKRMKSSKLTVLDIGAGSAWYWNEIESRISTFSLEVTLMDAVLLEGKVSNREQVSYKRLQGTVPAGLEEISTDAFDLVVAFDLIEHLSKEDGYRMLYEIDRISTGSSMIFTPNGHVWQPSSKNNPFNAHISGWTSSEMRKMGWSHVRGHTGFKILREPYGLKSNLVRSWPLSELDAILTIVSYRFPKVAFAFSAVKQNKNPRIENQDF